MSIEINRRIIAVVIYLNIFFVETTVAQNDSGKHETILTPNAKLILIDSSFGFTEGAATDKEGNVYFTDQPNDNIWKYDINGNLSLFIHGTKRSNGMYVDTKGNLISCADENDELISISPSKKITVLIKDFKGHTLNGPNDLWIDARGGMYITDPYFQRDYWTRKKPDSLLKGEYVYYLPAGSKQMTIADTTTKKPNGIIGTPDGKYLYAADMGDWKTYRYNINKDGTLSSKILFANEASDGMTIDNPGNIYFTNNGVTIYNAKGEKIEHIDVPEKWTANICFGGKDKSVLFITASKSLYKIQTKVKGVE